MRRTLKASGAAAAAACFLAVTAGTAQAQAPHATSLSAPSALVFTAGLGEDAASAEIERAATLTCAPRPSGSHPAAAAACAELARHDGRLDRLVNDEPDAVCTMEWQPVTLTANGVWNGRYIQWSATFANQCTMNASLAESTTLTF